MKNLDARIILNGGKGRYLREAAYNEIYQKR